jgi:hypothetical protein
VASGIYRAGTGDIRVAIAGVDAAYFTSIGLTLPSGKKVVTPTLEASSSLTIRTNGADAVTVDSSQNVGIGTTTPGTKVEVNGRITAKSSSDVNLAFVLNNTGTSGREWQLVASSTGGLDGGGTFNLRDNTASANRLTVDASGNLGLGMAPSAWASNRSVLQLKGGTTSGGAYLASGAAAQALLGTNAYSDGTVFRYLTSTSATLYSQFLGDHSWSTAPSGTAGNAITFTHAMTLTAAGRLGIGTASPQATLNVRTSDTYGVLVNTNNVSAGTTRLSLGGYQDAAGGTGGTAAIGCEHNHGVTAQSSLVFYTHDGGSLLERARITSGGDFLVNTTSAGADGGFTLLRQSDGIAAINNNHAASAGYVFTSFRRSGSEVGSVTQVGTTSISYNTSSDRRLKDNIVPAPSASDDIDAIQIVSHDWKAAPDEHVKYGVIAQDLYAVAPQAVTAGDDGEDIEKTWGVDYSKLVPMLIKEIQSLRARVAALEGQ